MTPGLISCGARPPPVDGPAFVSKRFHEGGGNGCVAGSDTLKVTAEDAPLTLAIWREVDAMTVVGRERVEVRPRPADVPREQAPAS